MKQLRLRADFTGPLLPVPAYDQWVARITGKYRWCQRCRVAMLAAVHKSELHTNTHRFIGGSPGGQYNPHHGVAGVQ